MAKKTGRITGQVRNTEGGIVTSTTLFFHDGSKIEVKGDADILLGEFMELTGEGPAPYTLTSIAPVQNGG